MARVRERAYPIPGAKCEQAKDCDERSLQIAAREAVTADASFDVALVQLALSFLGVGGVGFTLYYAHRAFVEAQRSADAAHKALGVTEHYGKIQLRAYVDLVEARIVDWEPGKAPRVIGTIKNSGATPAQNLRLIQAIAIRVFPLAEPLPLKEPEDEYSASVSAGETITTSVALQVINAAAITETLNKGAVYYWGTIKYDDVFGVPHRSSFCMHYGGPDPEPGGVLAAYKQGNSSD